MTAILGKPKKPPLTSHTVTCRRKPRQCSVCSSFEHDKRNCPKRLVAEDLAVDVSRVSTVTCDDAPLFSTALPSSVSHSESSSSCNSRKCLFCLSVIETLNSSGRPLLCCPSCTPVDVARPPFAIPMTINPVFGSSLAVAVRYLESCFPLAFLSTSSEKKSSRKRMSSSSQSSKRNLFRPLVFRGQFSSALAVLDGAELANNTSDTVQKLQNLHPFEESLPSFSNSQSYWTDRPITPSDVMKAISNAKSGKAAGPSGPSFDHLKIAVTHAPEVAEDLAYFFNLICSQPHKFPLALKNSRLVALSKPCNGVRPIAIGECVSRLFSSICFDRVKSKAVEYFRPFQFCIGIVDGTISASLMTDIFLNSSAENYVLNVDYKNAFNCVYRSQIHLELLDHFPELLSYFEIMYGHSSSLIFHEHTISSTRGVKQSESLGPFLFCLPLQRILRKFSSEFPGLKLNSYADDTSLVGPLEVIRSSFPRFVELSSSIGLSINFQKCLVIGRSSVDLNFGESSIPFVNYSDECVKFLGNYIGNDDKIKKTLSHKNNCIFQQLNQIVDLDVGEQVSLLCCKFVLLVKLITF
ncbi:hypothetical protein GEMRC1_003978 [Eukaryota sp. GEM-RC1]